MSNERLDLDVPGFKVSQQVSQKPALRAIWYLMFIVCSFISLRMIFERLIYYFSYPTGLTFAPSETEPFPSITICPSEQTFDMKLFDNYDTPPFYSAISQCQSSMEMIDCKQPELWTSHPSVYGTAYTLNLETFSNSSVSFVKFRADNSSEFIKSRYYSRDEDSFWKLLVHDHDEDILYGCVTSAIDIDANTEMRFTYTRKKTIYENIPTRPCQSLSEHQKCVIKCMENDFVHHSNLNCRLEFMTTVNYLPSCERNFDDHYGMIWTIGFLLQTNNMDYECACAKACDDSRFELDIDTDENENKTIISVARGRERTEVLRERMSYTGYSLLCEVGGIIGFYLGACLITFIQLLQHLSTRLYAHVNAPKGSPYVQKHMAHSKDCPCCNQPLPASVKLNHL